MTSDAFLDLVRGPLFQIALFIFLAGVLVRLVEILVLGRKTDFAEPRADGTGAGLRSVFSRSVPEAGTFKRSAFTILAGYVFHIGLFVALVFLAPHIALVRDTFGFGWPNLPTPLVDFATVAAIAALVAILVNRLRDPVLKFLTTFEDYLAWAVTFLPLLTGYMAFHHLLIRYEGMLALHILSVELLLVVFPFSKLMHTFTLFLARWYTGSAFGRKGVQS
ncbi:MAG: hypothetical protein R3D02_14140 [Hyphomicrobiales bacterium]